jgi:RNA 2',3'-cyclic 3'-phosphodiesterase
MRLFVAIDIPDDVKEALRAFVTRLRPLAKLQWSPLDNLHVTTKFIGDWPADRLDEIKHALEGVAAPEPLHISVRHLGWFPNERRPRVFWAGVDGGEALATLARSTEQAVAALGVPVEERDYSPHLTLARLRESVPLNDLQSKLRSLPVQNFGSFQASRFFLYQSAGGKYTQLAGFPLD